MGQVQMLSSRSGRERESDRDTCTIFYDLPLSSWILQLGSSTGISKRQPNLYIDWLQLKQSSSTLKQPSKIIIIYSDRVYIIAIQYSNTRIPGAQNLLVIPSCTVYIYNSITYHHSHEFHKLGKWIIMLIRTIVHNVLFGTRKEIKFLSWQEHPKNS